MSRFITFEGIEGSGKSTQVARASDLLTARGVTHLRTREPGGTPLGDAVRRILLHPEHDAMSPRAELLLVHAARAQHLEAVVRPALAAGKVVLCDRFEDSTRAYQGRGRGIPEEMIAALSELTAAGLRPDRTFLLDLDVEEGLRRARGRNAQPGGPASDEGRIDSEAVEFHRRVRQGYLDLARRDPDRFRVLDGAEPAERIAARIAGELLQLLGLN
jgi:dTMP kinase